MSGEVSGETKISLLLLSVILAIFSFILYHNESTKNFIGLATSFAITSLSCLIMVILYTIRDRFRRKKHPSKTSP